jgi:hypothetical protein
MNKKKAQKKLYKAFLGFRAEEEELERRKRSQTLNAVFGTISLLVATLSLFISGGLFLLTTYLDIPIFPEMSLLFGLTSFLLIAFSYDLLNQTNKEEDALRQQKILEEEKELERLTQ